MTSHTTIAPPIAAANASIDVRNIPPREHHPLIFSAFRALAAGQSLELVNDHDPMPLYDHFQAEQPGGFGWDYLEGGPIWRVRISKLARVESTHGQGSCCGACGGA
ncbi:MAG: DUF2249 domain-containing protein [Burkholderiales bacterium]